MRHLIYSAVSALALVPSVASAGLIVGSASAGWQSFPTTLNNYNDSARRFWDQNSLDGPNLNIGNYLRGPFNGVTTPTVTPQGWGRPAQPSPRIPFFKPQPTDNSDADYHFSHTPTEGSLTAVLVGEYAQYHDLNAVGWYNADNPAETHLLWAGSDSPTVNATIEFTPTAHFGFFMVSPLGTYYSDASLTPGRDHNRQHFAAFALSLTPGEEKFLVGVEDLPADSSKELLGDFQDFIFTVQPTSTFGGSTPPPPVPEPATALLLLAAAPLMLRRRAPRR